jgi:hypothetical protein
LKLFLLAAPNIFLNFGIVKISNIRGNFQF